MGGGGCDHSFLGIFQCSKHSYLALGSPKTNCVFTPNSIFHTNLNIFVPMYLPSHLQFVETSYVRNSRCFAKMLSKNLPKLVSGCTWHPKLSKNCPEKKLRRSQFSKWGGGGLARYDHDHRFNGYFFMASISTKMFRKINNLSLSGHERISYLK